MKKLVITTAALVMVSTGAANAEFKIAEFTFGEQSSLKNTFIQSIEKYASGTAPYQKTDVVEIRDLEFDNLFENLKEK